MESYACGGEGRMSATRSEREQMEKAIEQAREAFKTLIDLGVLL
jgi:hypothetical protein